MERIPLTEEQKKILTPAVNDVNAAFAGYVAASKYVQITREDLFKAIFEMFPESVERHPSISHGKNEEWYLILSGWSKPEQTEETAKWEATHDINTSGMTATKR